MDEIVSTDISLNGESEYETTGRPDCCSGRAYPCCDRSCLDRLAMRECKSSVATAGAPGCSDSTAGYACSRHTLSILDHYESILQTLGCICRALIALGQDSCCEVRERRSMERKQCWTERPDGSLAVHAGPIPSSATCVLPQDDDPIHLREDDGENKYSVNRNVSKSCFSENRSAEQPARLAKVASCCCQPRPSAKRKTIVVPLDSCYANEKNDEMGLTFDTPQPCYVVSECAQNRCKHGDDLRDGCEVKETSCCIDTSPPDISSDVTKSPAQATADIENQSSGKEHVVLSISGMTCTGCETKLNRVLATNPAVQGLKTSLILSRAEFDVDLRLGAVEEIVKNIERATGFQCEKLRDQGSNLDLIVHGDTLLLVNSKWPDGIIDIALIGKHIVRVVFDPKIIGARDLAEKTWGSMVELAPPRAESSLETGNKHVRHVGYSTLFSIALTIPILVMAWAPLAPNEETYASVSLACATIVQVVIAGPFYPKALKALVFSRVLEADLLIVMSTSAAYIFSLVSYAYLMAKQPLSTGLFFQTSTLLVTLIMIGRWFASFARQKAVESISVRSLQVATAILVHADNTEREIDARLLQYGDTFKVLPDSRIPTDGTVIAGSSEVDESMLTGESRPVEKFLQSIVIAGSLNGPGVMTVMLNRLPSESTICAIAAMVDEAKLSKPRLQLLADKVASFFVPSVLALTVATFTIWVAVGITVREYNSSEAIIQALLYAITVLIVSCPCAIGLAVPMVVVIASGLAAEQGIIFKSAETIELACHASHVVFDKTGTLTHGKLSVVATDGILEDKLPLLLGLIRNSRHPVSIAVAGHLEDMGVVASNVAEPKSLTGCGIQSVSEGHDLRAGSPSWLNLMNHELVIPILGQGCTVFCFMIDNTLCAVYGLEDELRPGTAETISALQDQGISVHVVSGDNNSAVQALVSGLGIPSENVRAQSSPAEKMDYVKRLVNTGSKQQETVVVFCGDGTNDAAALASATIGVHINQGTDVAQSAADVVLMRPSLTGILTMIKFSRRSVARIKFNFAWSFMYNTFAILLAAGALVRVRIPPQYAGLGELVSVVPIIVAAVMLRWPIFKHKTAVASKLAS